MGRGNVTRQLPIGYWLKRLDEVITRYTDQTLAEKGFTRPQWQTLNSVYDAGNITRQDLFATMQTFLDEPQLDAIIGRFVKLGWLVEQDMDDDTRLAITDIGKAEREKIFRLQSEVRKRLMQGITETEYTTVLDVLQRMVKNLE